MRHSPFLYVAAAVLGALGALISELIFDDTVNWVTVLVTTPIGSIIGIFVGLYFYDRRNAT